MRQPCPSLENFCRSPKRRPSTRRIAAGCVLHFSSIQRPIMPMVIPILSLGGGRGRGRGGGAAQLAGPRGPGGVSPVAEVLDGPGPAANEPVQRRDRDRAG